MSDKYTEPEWSKAALLTIDVQRDFVRPNDKLVVEGTAEPIRAMAATAKAFRSARLPIVHIVRMYLPDGSNADLCRRSMIEEKGAIAAPGTEGALVVEELLPPDVVDFDFDALLRDEPQLVGVNEWVMYKSRWSAFFRTRLEDHLRNLGVTTVVLCGLNFPNCPRTTIYEATALDFRVVAVSDAVSGVYDRGLEELKGIGVVVLASEEVADEALRASQSK